MQAGAARKGSVWRGFSRRIPRSAGTLAAALLLAALVAGTAGCKGTQKASDDGLMDAYQAGDYSRAYREASAEASSGPSSGGQRDMARFVAGMSAYQLGRADEAMRHLGQVSDHDEASIAGPANATLGLILARRSEHERAIEHFRKAVKNLKGADTAQAYYHMGLSEQKLGRWSSARLHMQRALKVSNDAAFREKVRQRLKASAFTVQLGAFSDRENAERMARKIRSKAESANLGAPRVVPSRSNSGKRLYLVQVGRFKSEAEAKRAMRRLNRTEGIIAPLVEK
jgi:tetratricopeptide (TPR) repeat protein